MGTLRSILTCQNCGSKRTRVESFVTVSLPLLKDSSKQTEGNLSIEKCLEDFTRQKNRADLVDCPLCNKNMKSTQQHAFVALPEILCLFLNRFDAVANKKITESVSFPAHGLNMGKYLAHW